MRMNRTAVLVTTHKDQASDYQYWVTRPVSERLDAIEMLRQTNMSTDKYAPSRLQRVYRITQQS
jgi:hypothetical protein